MTDRDRLIELCNKKISTMKFNNSDHWFDFTERIEQIADYLLANGVIVLPKKEKKMVYFPFPIDCENCSKVTEIGVCEELDLLYAGKHPKYSKEQDWDFMCANCPKGISEREYTESDEKHIGKTVFLTKEEAEEKLRECEGK